MTLTRQELADLLQVSTRQLDRMRHDKTFPRPITKPPRHPRWSKAAIEKWLGDKQ